MEKLEALKTLRTLKSRTREDGIFLVLASRYRESCERVARLVEAAGGEVMWIAKSGKTKIDYVAGTATLTERITYTVGILEDSYIMGRILPANTFHKSETDTHTQRVGRIPAFPHRKRRERC